MRNRSKVREKLPSGVKIVIGVVASLTKASMRESAPVVPVTVNGFWLVKAGSATSGGGGAEKRMIRSFFLPLPSAT